MRSGENKGWVLAIVPGSLLLLNSVSVAPLAEVTYFVFRLRGNTQAIGTALEEAGQLNADRQHREVDDPVRSPALVAFDAEGRTVETLLSTGNVLDVFV